MENNKKEVKTENVNLPISNVSVSLSKDFANFIGTEYIQDNGCVIGNIYYERGVENSKDFTIDELWDIFIINKNN
jgi:hypothetical protein